MRFYNFLITSMLAFASLTAQTSLYPVALDTDAQMPVAKNLRSGKLITGISATDNVIGVTPSGIFQANMLITIDSEVMMVCGVSGNLVQIGAPTSGCPNVAGRGFDGSTAVTHGNNSVVRALVTAYHNESLKAAIKAIESTLSTNMQASGNRNIHWLGKGNIEGPGVAGAGVDLPQVHALSDGTVAAPSTSPYPAMTYTRINQAAYQSGVGNYVFYGLKKGVTGGVPSGSAMENISVSSRQVGGPSDLVGIYNRVVLDQSSADTPTGRGTGWAYVGSVAKFSQYDWVSVTELNPDNQSRVNASAFYGGTGMSNGLAIVGAGNALNSEALYIGAQTNLTTLAGSINNSATTFTLTEGSQFNAPATLIIGTEHIRCNTIVGSVYSACTRGYEATAAASHTAGDLITPAAPFGQFQQGIEFAPGSLLPTANAVLMPNTTRISSWNPAGTVVTPLLYQSVADTILNAGAGATLFFAHGGTGGVSIDGIDRLIAATKTWAGLGGSPPSGATLYCSDCDPPAAEGNGCTTGGASTGAYAIAIRGAWKCFGH